MIKVLQHKFFRGLVFVSAFSLVSVSAWALNLDQAKAKGMVKEKDGYLVVVKPTDEAKDLVKKVNSGRKAEYQKIANKRGTSLEAVEKLAAEKLAK